MMASVPRCVMSFFENTEVDDYVPGVIIIICLSHLRTFGIYVSIIDDYVPGVVEFVEIIDDYWIWVDYDVTFWS